MLDSYNRIIDYIRISVTDRCNLRCIYCMPEEGISCVSHNDILTYEEMIHLCKCFAKLGIRKVKITGGEPLVRKNLSYLIENIKNIDGIEKVTLTTNGILLAEQMEDLYKAGIDGINVSLDTLDADKFFQLTRFDQLGRVLHGIQTALKYPMVTLKINCVPIKKYNDTDNIVSLINMAKYQKIHIRFIELMPIGYGKNMDSFSEKEIKEIIEKNIGTLTPNSDNIGNGPGKYYNLEGYSGKVGFISAMSHEFCDSCNRVRLTAQGILKTCLQYKGGTNLKELLRSEAKDTQLLQVIKDTILQKPERHAFKEEVGTDTRKEFEEGNMSQIGG